MVYLYKQESVSSYSPNIQVRLNSIFYRVLKPFLHGLNAFLIQKTLFQRDIVNRSTYIASFPPLLGFPKILGKTN